MKVLSSVGLYIHSIHVDIMNYRQTYVIVNISIVCVTKVMYVSYHAVQTSHNTIHAVYKRCHNTVCIRCNKLTIYIRKMFVK